MTLEFVVPSRPNSNYQDFETYIDRQSLMVIHQCTPILKNETMQFNICDQSYNET